MEQTFKKSFVFTKNICVDTEVLTLIHSRLDVWSLTRQSFHLNLAGSEIWAHRPEELLNVPQDTYGNAHEISARFDGSDFEFSFAFYRRPESPKSFSTLGSYATVSSTQESKLHILAAIANELQDTFDASKRDDCGFVSAVQPESVLARSHSAGSSTNSDTAMAAVKSRSIFSGEVRLTKEITWSNDSIGEIVKLYEAFHLKVKVTVQFKSGEERNTDAFGPEFASDEELSSAAKVSVFGRGEDSSGDSIFFSQQKGSTSRFAIDAKTGESVEERKRKLTEFATRKGLLKLAQQPKKMLGNSEFPVPATKSGWSLKSVMAVVTVMLGAAGFYLNSRQTKNSDKQTENNSSQTTMMSHSDQAKLIFVEKLGGENTKNEALMSFTVTNIGKSAAISVRVRCGDPDLKGAVVPFGPIAVQQTVSKLFPIDLDRSNSVRDPERHCLSGEIYATYKDDAGGTLR